jgi:uncharacterized membrane protein
MAQNAIDPAIGWILSANKIKLVAPAMISESMETTPSVRSTKMILLSPEFCSVIVALIFQHNSPPSLLSRNPLLKGRR